MRKIKLIGAAALVVLTASPALSQESGLVLPPAPPAPEQLIAPPSAIGTPAPMPLQGPGGFATTPPAPGAEDAAERQTLTGADKYADQMIGQSDKRLEGLVGAKLSPQTESDLEAMMRIRRSNMLLSLKNEEAELAVSLWGTLYNNEHAQAWRERERADTEAREKAESEDAAARLAQMAEMTKAQQQAAAKEVMPVVYEVNGGTAILLVANQGEMVVRSGSVLPNGWEVTSVSASGVGVKRGDQRQMLGFGVAVSAPAPSPMMMPQ